jgi:hypothetical protein
MLSGLRFLAWVQEHEGARCPLLVALCTRLCRCCLSNAQTRQVASGSPK